MANIAGQIPLQEHIKLKIRVLKLAALCDSLSQWLQSEMKLQHALSQVVLAILFVVAAYMPALVCSIIYASTCKKPEKAKYEADLFVYNRPDSQEITAILQTVTKLQKSIGGQQDGELVKQPGGSQASAETQEQLTLLTRQLNQVQVRSGTHC